MARKPRKPTTTKALAPIPTLPLTPIPGTAIMPDAAYSNEFHPQGPGPWSDEADKVAWTDAASGYPCVIRREPGGELASYVGIPPEHPLSGFAADALPPAIGKGLHRPVTYSGGCQRHAPERLSICHVPYRSGAEADMAEARDDAWWLGMRFDGPRDFVPSHHRAVLGPERGQVYRDQAFAYQRAVALARQLHAFAQGRSTAETSPKAICAYPERKREDKR